jgi:hypothetical protein
MSKKTPLCYGVTRWANNTFLVQGVANSTTRRSDVLRTTEKLVPERLGTFDTLEEANAVYNEWRGFTNE